MLTTFPLSSADVRHGSLERMTPATVLCFSQIDIKSDSQRNVCLTGEPVRGNGEERKHLLGQSFPFHVCTGVCMASSQGVSSFSAGRRVYLQLTLAVFHPNKKRIAF